MREMKKEHSQKDKSRSYRTHHSKLLDGSVSAGEVTL